MKNRVFATLSSLMLLTAATAFAQSSVVMHADIPFEFRAGTRVFPAGHYEVRPEIVGGVLSIRCFECNAHALIQTIATQGRTTPETGALVFNRYDRTYFLSKVWTRGYSQGRELHKGKAERELARNITPVPPAAVALARR